MNTTEQDHKVSRKRTPLTLKEKIEILDKVNLYMKQGVTHRQLAKLLEKPKSTIVCLMKKEHILRREWQYVHANRDLAARTRMRGGKRYQLETALREWCANMVQNGGKLSGPIVKAKAEEFALIFKCENFNASDGWLSRWKIRSNIKYKKGHEEEPFPDISLPYSDEDICNVDDPLSLLPIQNCVAHYESENSNFIDSSHDISGGLSESEAYVQDFTKLEHSHGNDESIKQFTDKLLHHEIDYKTENKDIKKEEQQSNFITAKHAKKCIVDLRQYFLQKGNEDSPQIFLNICEEYINSKQE